MMKPLFNISLPTSNTKKLKWGSLPNSVLAYVLSLVVQSAERPVLFIADNNHQMQYLFDLCQFFIAGLDTPPQVAIFPDWEILPYDYFSPHQDIISERLALLAALPYWKHGLLFTTVNTALTRTIPVDFVQSNAFVMKQGGSFQVTEFRQRLQQYGYYSVSQVMNHGEYASRGSIFDIYPMGCDKPLRIDLFDDVIDSIRIFDPETQRTQEIVSEINILPAHEFPLNEASISQFRKAWRQHFESAPTSSPVYEAISNGSPIQGIENYLPLFYESMGTLFDYLPNQSIVINTTNYSDVAIQFTEEVAKRYHQCYGNITRPLLEPALLFLSPQELSTCMNSFCSIHVTEQAITENTGRHNYPTSQLTNLALKQPGKESLHRLQDFMARENNTKFIFTAESAGRLERLQSLLQQINVRPTIYSQWQTIDFASSSLAMIVAPLEQGIVFTETCFECSIVLISENDLLGQQVSQHRRQKTTDIDTELLIRNLNELTLNTPVTHIEHGVGRYRGLETLTVNELAQEFLLLEYQGGDKLYVPVTSLHMISRYSGVDVEHAPLHRLGSDQWDKAKRKAAKKIHDVAAELLALEAQRQARPGFAYPLPKTEYAIFSSAFPFEETPDQVQAIEAVLNDLAKEQASDRLICGDVGFGKTEVAMRAAFVVVHHNKQVAVLVPTTLLAQQHYETFKNRFADSAVNIAMLSRFNTAKQQSDIVTKLTSGQVDIVIGTHKLLQPSIQFKDLGLIVIDEEHRFGVRHKERLKQLRADVDILTLTATPIPRTLNMALSGMREISLIATPPARRLAIKTFVHERENSLIREALLREILRGGQVYFLHNKIATIEQTADIIRTLVPEARVRVAHGQMAERELEQVMNEFYHQQFNVLVCTTIIETGIDVPTANTIVMDRADCFGLAQLHQLRGRVGRSHHQAYAYLLTPDAKTMTKDALQRLDAISAMEDLGAGFNLASHDLEIRGAGELLGDEQSGHIQEIGFTLYMELLERAVTALKSGQDLNLSWTSPLNTEVDLKIPALIPDDYLQDVHMRLVLYKRIASCQAQSELDDIEVEMIDRFGRLPEATKNLLQITSLKLEAEKLGIIKVLLHNKGGTIEFDPKPNFDPVKLIHLIQDKPQTYQMRNATTLKIRCETLIQDQRVAFLHEIYSQLK